MVMNGRYAVLFEKDNLFKKFMPLLWTKIRVNVKSRL